MANPFADRRSARRFPLAVVAEVRLWKSASPEQSVELINFSAQGLYFASRHRFSEGDLVEMSLKLPLVTEGPLPEWHCVGKVVRVQRLGTASNVVGVALRLREGRVGKPVEPGAEAGVEDRERANTR